MGKDINSIVKCFFVYYSWLAVFCTENIIRKKWSSIEQASNETSERLLLKNPGGTYLQIHTDIYGLQISDL